MEGENEPRRGAGRILYLGPPLSGCCLRTPETPFPGCGFQGSGSLCFSLLPLNAQQLMGTIFSRIHLPEFLKLLNLSAWVEKKVFRQFLQVDSWKAEEGVQRTGVGGRVVMRE